MSGMGRFRAPVVPVTLEGRVVRLEPLARRHFAALWDVAQDPELWRWTVSQPTTAKAMRAYLDDALAARDAGLALPFALVVREGGAVVGSTRFGAIAPAHGRVEVGWTWVAAPWQRTAVNTEAKRLLLAHAFETWGCTRVEFKTDARNARSRAAIVRLGATEEGVLRRHTYTAAGHLRDTVYFSILADEWPAVRERLDARLAAG